MKLALSAKNAWEHLPQSSKAVLGPLIGALPLPWLLGRRFRSNLRFVEAAQWWSADETRAHQLIQLRRIIRLAYERTSYYRRTFDAVGFTPADLDDVQDLRQLPTIDRSTLREHLTEMCTLSPTAARVDYTATGGTGGEPLAFYIDAGRSAVEYAYLVSSWCRAGFIIGMPLAVFRGRRVPKAPKGFRHEYDPLLRLHYYSTFHMTDADLRCYLRDLRDIGPCFLHVYPSSATALARFLQGAGLEPPPNVHGLIAESENVYPDQRRLVEAIFGHRLFSCYGLTEKVVAAAECEHTTDYHVWPTYGFFELLDEAGQPVTTPGQRGEIVGTGFINEVVPFVRYRTGDFATYVGERCSACGRAQPIITDIRGHRIQEVLVAADGGLITWTSLNVHDDSYARILRFQFRQDTPGRARLRLLPAPGFAERDGDHLLRTLNAKLDGRLRLELDVVESLPTTGLGKAIYVDQRIPGIPVRANDGDGPFAARISPQAGSDGAPGR
jgi:phenylacetate-CoA ligase